MLIAKTVSKKRKKRKMLEKKNLRIKISPFTRGWSVSTLVSDM